MNAEFDIELAGDTAIVTALEALKGAALTDVLVNRLYEQLKGVMKISQDEYVPVDTGNLRDSGFVDEPFRADDQNALVYMGYRASYAAAVHEIPPRGEGISPSGRTANHPHGQWKYLETPLNEWSEGMLPGLGKEVMDDITGKV
jgi:hypothetical protein